MMMVIIHLLLVMVLLSSIPADSIPSQTRSAGKAADAINERSSGNGANRNPSPTQGPARATGGDIAASPSEDQVVETISHHVSRHATKGLRSRATDDAGENSRSADAKPQNEAAPEATGNITAESLRSTQAKEAEGEVGQSGGQGQTARKLPVVGSTKSNVTAGEGEAKALDAGISDQNGSTSVRKLQTPKVYCNLSDSLSHSEEEISSPFGEEIVDREIVRARAEAIAKYPGQRQVKAHAMAIADKAGQTADAVAIARGSTLESPASPPEKKYTSNKKKGSVLVKGSFTDSKKLLQTLLQLIVDQPVGKPKVKIPNLDSSEPDISIEYDNNYEYGDHDFHSANQPLSLKLSPYFQPPPSKLGGKNPFLSSDSWVDDHDSFPDLGLDDDFSYPSAINKGVNEKDFFKSPAQRPLPPPPPMSPPLFPPQRPLPRPPPISPPLFPPPHSSSFFAPPPPLAPLSLTISHTKNDPPFNDVGGYNPVNGYLGEIGGMQINSNRPPKWQNHVGFSGGPSANSRFSIKTRYKR